ncbi:MAG: hypothetical protein JWQ68_666 [Cryobacterium sp.]|jgi:hypothetical protein|nr:hypothetical protein [Cryobacterium sp.]
MTESLSGDDTTSATDDSSVGFGNRPEEFMHDLGLDQSGGSDGVAEAGAGDEADADAPDLDRADSRPADLDAGGTPLAGDTGKHIDVDREATGIPGAPGTAAGPDEEMPD